jgi:superfamily II DNA or RNA helicase
VRLTTPEEVRAVIAAHLLGGAAEGRVLGTVTLHKHQCEALSRLRDIIALHGGALLADEVGLGKTYVALALAAERERPVVVAPASLRPMWRRASSLAGVRVRFVSMERLGHGGTVPPAGIIVVDEAHHFRNRVTNRYRQLADACTRSPVLLLSATPVQNTLDDLRHLLALAIGERALALDRTALTKLIVRRSAGAIARGADLPRVAEPVPIDIPADEDCLNQICALPPCAPTADGEYAHELLTFSLAKQWASSRAALIAALRRRMAMARAMDDALTCGKRLTRAELAMWRYADGAQQLAFPELTSAAAVESRELLEQVRAHHDGVRALVASLRHQPDTDRSRANALVSIAQRHPGERIVAFAHYAETVSVLHRLLSPRARVAALTHSGGRVAGGAISRRDILAQFSSSARTPEHARIDLLLTTDVLSEGVDMQQASVVVHLDLPWNPARMEQRVGRLRRPGALRDAIAVYMLAPPAPAERLLQMDRRLRAKLGEAARSVGLAGAILPSMPSPPRSALIQRENILKAIEQWLRPWASVEGVVAGAVRSECDGAIACIRCDGEVLLVLLHDGCIEPNPSPDFVAGMSALEPARCDLDRVNSAQEQIAAWMHRRVATDVVQLPITETARSRRLLLQRIDSIAGRVRRHERSAWSASLGAARRAATITMPIGAERVLDKLARAPLADEAWLRAVGQFAQLHARGPGASRDEILALLVLRRD